MTAEGLVIILPLSVAWKRQEVSRVIIFLDSFKTVIHYIHSFQELRAVSVSLPWLVSSFLVSFHNEQRSPGTKHTLQ